MNNVRLKVRIRFMIRRDLPDVMRIEDEACGHLNDHWTTDGETFLSFLRGRNYVGMVAESVIGYMNTGMVAEFNKSVIVGYMLYSLGRFSLDVAKLVVDPKWQRQGVGAQLVDKAKSNLSHHRRRALSIDVGDENLGGQLFLRSQGLRATHIIREGDGVETYHMVYEV